VELEITPEPSPEERAAIEAAVEATFAEGALDRGAWWRAGVAGGADDEDDVGSP
jgi:hypothetical protein